MIGGVRSAVRQHDAASSSSRGCCPSSSTTTSRPPSRASPRTRTRSRRRWAASSPGWRTRASSTDAPPRPRWGSRVAPRTSCPGRWSWRTLLDRQADRVDPTLEFEPADVVDGLLRIERVQPGMLWFADGVGPVPIGEAARRVAQAGWWVDIIVAAKGGFWHVLDVGPSTRSGSSLRNRATSRSWSDIRGAPD